MPQMYLWPLFESTMIYPIHDACACATTAQVVHDFASISGACCKGKTQKHIFQHSHTSNVTLSFRRNELSECNGRTTSAICACHLSSVLYVWHSDVLWPQVIAKNTKPVGHFLGKSRAHQCLRIPKPIYGLDDKDLVIAHSLISYVRYGHGNNWIQD